MNRPARVLQGAADRTWDMAERLGRVEQGNEHWLATWLYYAALAADSLTHD